MIFRLDAFTCEITTVTPEEARRALEAHRPRPWSPALIGECLFGAKMLFTHTAYYCRIQGRLDEFLANSQPTAPQPFGTADIYAVIHNTEARS